MALSQKAVKFIKQNKQLLIDEFANEKIFKSVEKPMSLFMAGSAGAGKTEYSKALIKELGYPIVRIDADDVKDIIPQYTGSNSSIVQGASSLGVEKLYDYVLKKKLNVILDGTFADFAKARVNIERSIRRERAVAIFYLYQDPLIAWEFTKKREKLEGRKVPLNVFIDSLFKSKANVNKIKAIFKHKVKVFLIKKNYKNEVEKAWSNITQIDDYLKIPYTQNYLASSLKKITL